MHSEEIFIPCRDVQLKGRIQIPGSPRGLVIFPYKAENTISEHDYNIISAHLREHNLATFMIQLLSKEESAAYQNHFNFRLLSERIILVNRWILEHEKLKHADRAYFCEDTDTVPAFYSATESENPVRAIVSYGGRTDLVLPLLKKVKVPTLLLCGSLDEGITSLNQVALRHFGGRRELQIIPEVSRLFLDYRSLDKVAQKAREWFEENLHKFYKQERAKTKEHSNSHTLSSSVASKSNLVSRLTVK
jgi:putative phosphoribosyl transferase